MTVVFPAPLGPDQGVAGALLDPQRQLAGHPEPVEVLFQPHGFQREGHGTSPRARQRWPCGGDEPDDLIRRPQTQRCMRWRPISTIHDQHEADPELPVLRRQRRKQFLQHSKHHRADQSAVEIAGAAITSTSMRSAERSNENTSSEASAVLWVNSAPAIPA